MVKLDNVRETDDVLPAVTDHQSVIWDEIRSDRRGKSIEN